MNTHTMRHFFQRFSFVFLSVLTAVWLSACFISHTANAKSWFGVDATTAKTIAQADLPSPAQKILVLIQQGGPFKYKDKDGSTFGNREGVLPKQARGYYSEYTVKTAATKDRGPIRIIAGKGKTGDPATSGEYYYTEDHYATFKRIILTPAGR